MISVVIPTYNERSNVERATLEIEGVLQPLRVPFEILFVDDKSPDGTAEVIQHLSEEHPAVRLVTKEKKEGIGAAHMAGFGAAHGGMFMTIDADLSQSPHDLVRFKEALDNGLDLVIGSRYTKGGAMHGKSWVRHVGSVGMNVLSRVLLGLPYGDASHTFRAFRREVYDRVKKDIHSKGHPSFTIEFTYRAHRLHYRIGEIPVRFQERSKGYGASKVNILREVPKYLWCLLKLRLEFLGYRAQRREV
ncbi:MAG: polyprenol monophosphomannose synthase [Candidatus Omnitrophica bacterium]|nr:polyprenol monophosphomannose synthase [Candidatus Omnitrophota bacterium]